MDFRKYKLQLQRQAVRKSAHTTLANTKRIRTIFDDIVDGYWDNISCNYDISGMLAHFRHRQFHSLSLSS